jgi:L-alanine-DL-glutamate epimerase-like enolase superfamily enzyme
MDSWIALVDDVERAGFKALKTNLLVPGLASGLPPTLDGAIDRSRIDAAVAFVGALRERVGPSMGILFDVGQEYRHGGIVQLARALEPFNLYWLEAEGFDPDALLTARRRTRTRLCHGEALIRREQFRPFLERHVTDVVMVETLANGLSEARRICELAAHYDTMVSPHNYMSPLATLINAHLCAAMPNVEIFEIDMDDVPWKWDLIDQPIEIVDGELVVPSRPGLGANIVEEVVAAHPLAGGRAQGDLLDLRPTKLPAGVEAPSTLVSDGRAD